MQQPPIRPALASVLAAMMLAVGAAGRATETLAAPAHRTCSVDFYGDSILYGGYGANLGNRLPDPPAAAMRRIRPAWKDARNHRPFTGAGEPVETAWQVRRHRTADCRRRGAVFADWGSVSFDAAQMIDDIHPPQAYSARLAQRLAMTMDRVAPESRV